MIGRIRRTQENQEAQLAPTPASAIRRGTWVKTLLIIALASWRLAHPATASATTLDPCGVHCSAHTIYECRDGQVDFGSECGGCQNEGSWVCSAEPTALCGFQSTVYCGGAS